MIETVTLIQSECFPKGGKIHLARQYEATNRAGAVVRRGWVADCNGISLGGIYQHELREGDPLEVNCSRCRAKMAARLAALSLAIAKASA